MTEQEVRTLLTDALVNLFEIEPERIKPEPTSTKIWKSTASTPSTSSTTSNAKPAANCKPKTSATCAP